MDIMGVRFLSEIEAASRYGYSKSWFSKKRLTKGGPPFIKMADGRILYNLEKTDTWFKDKMVEKE